MNAFWITGLIASSLLVVPGTSRPVPSSQSSGLTRVPPQQVPTPPGVEEWRQRLTDADLARRERSFDDVVASARSDEGLRAALEEWAADSSAGELAWTARLALRETRRVPTLLDDWGPGVDAWGGAGSFEELRQRLESMLQPFGGVAPSMPPEAGSSFESLHLEMDESGVTCKVTKKVDGREVTEEYRAATLDELLQAHPELRDRIQAGGDPRGAFDLSRGLRLRLTDPWALRGLQPDVAPRVAPGVRTDILGVVVAPLSADEAHEAGLEPGIGLRIERVEPGTIAAQLGLQRGHVLVEIDRDPIRARDDITRHIRERQADDGLEVTVVDRWGQRRRRAWTPAHGKQI